MNIEKEIHPPKWLTHAMKEVELEVIECPSDYRTTDEGDTILVFRIRTVPMSIQLEKLRKKLSNRGFKVDIANPVRNSRHKVLKAQGWVMNNMMNRLESPVNYTNADAKPKPKRSVTTRKPKVLETFNPNVVVIEAFAMVTPQYVSFIRACHGSIKSYIERHLSGELDERTYYKLVQGVLDTLKVQLRCDAEMDTVMFTPQADNCNTSHLNPNDFKMDVNDLIDDRGFFRNTTTAIARTSDRHFDSWRLFTAKVCMSRFLIMYFVEDKNQTLENYNGGSGSRFNYFGTSHFPLDIKNQMMDFAGNIAFKDDEDVVASKDFRSKIYSTVKEALEVNNE